MSKTAEQVALDHLSNVRREERAIETEMHVLRERARQLMERRSLLEDITALMKSEREAPETQVVSAGRN